MVERQNGGMRGERRVGGGVVRIALVVGDSRSVVIVVVVICTDRNRPGRMAAGVTRPFPGPALLCLCHLL